MRHKIAAALLASTFLVLGAATFAGPARAQPAQPPAAEPVRYTARQFFETTSFGMASSEGIAFSRDGRNLLIGSDKSGVFNTFALPVAGGEPVQISQSTTDATFGSAISPMTTGSCSRPTRAATN